MAAPDNPSEVIGTSTVFKESFTIAPMSVILTGTVCFPTAWSIEYTDMLIAKKGVLKLMIARGNTHTDISSCRLEKRIESIKIAGRNGSLHLDEGVYDSYDRTMECALKKREKKKWKNR